MPGSAGESSDVEVADAQGMGHHNVGCVDDGARHDVVKAYALQEPVPSGGPRVGYGFTCDEGERRLKVVYVGLAAAVSSGSQPAKERSVATPLRTGIDAAAAGGALNDEEAIGALMNSRAATATRHPAAS